MKKLTIDLKNGNKFRIGYRTPGFTSTHSPEEKMKLACELGMEIVEPMIVFREITSVDYAIELKAAADKFGIEIPSTGIMFPFTDPDADKKIEEDIELALQCAKALDIDYIFSTVSYPPENIPQQDTWNILVPRVQHVASVFESNGIKLAIEPEWFICSLERMKKLLRLVDHSNCYVNYDPTNFYVGGSDPVEIFDDEMGKLVSKGHIKDAVYQTNKHSEVQVGDGELDYETIFKRIIDRGTGMDMFIEHCSTVDKLTYSVESIRKLI